MTTLRIEHALTDYDTWRGAFERAAPFREQAGVRSYRIQRPIDDPDYLMIYLWASPDNPPDLSGQPSARIVETVEATPR